LALVNSRRTEAYFSPFTKTDRIPYGVDITRFHPIHPEERAGLRRELGLPVDTFFILHVGHVIRRRGLDTLVRLTSKERIVLVVGSRNTPPDKRIRRMLEASGVVVWTDYLPRIERLYAAADCYAFPTRDPLGAIEIPFSVTEAMACNLPVLAHPFGALPELFPADGGVIYESAPERWTERIETLRSSGPINNRAKVILLDWRQVIPQLEACYSDLLRRDRK
jgi:glycosyltransferase involved in cell wall biosynthesis